MRVLLQTTIPTTPDDWSIERFSMLHPLLVESGHDVTSRNKDESLAGIDRTSFDQIWLFAVDTGHGIAVDGIAESSFHHLVDYNWDPRAGSPSFVADPPSDDVIRDPRRLDDVKT